MCLFATSWTVAHQAPMSMGFYRQESWRELSFLSPGDLPDPRIQPRSPALQMDSLLSEPPVRSKGIRFWEDSIHISLLLHFHNFFTLNFFLIALTAIWLKLLFSIICLFLVSHILWMFHEKRDFWLCLPQKLSGLEQNHTQYLNKLSNEYISYTVYINISQYRFPKRKAV